MIKHISLFSLVLLFLTVSNILYCQETDELLAAQYLRNKEYDKAAEIYKELLENNPSSPIFYNNLLDCYVQMDDIRQAQRLVRDQSKRFPDQIRYDVDHGWLIELGGNQRRARRHFEGLISDVAANSVSIIALADAFELRNYLDFALDTYLKGRNIFGKNKPFNRQVARIYEKKKDYTAMMNEYVDMFALGSPYFEQAQGILQDAINEDPDFSKNIALRQVLLQRTQIEPNNFIFSEMLLWLSIQQKDFRLAFNQARALDRRMGKNGELVLNVARLSASNQEYDIAIQAFSYITGLGKQTPYYLDGYVGLLDAKFNRITSEYVYEKEDLLEVEREFEAALKEFGINSRSVILLRNLANLKAFYLDKTEDAVELLESAIETTSVSNRIKAECRIELADILVLNGEVWEANLLYAFVDRTFRDDPLAHEARFKNARLSYFIGEFDWAKAQLDVLKAATSKLIANDAMKLSLHIQDNIGFDKDTKPLERFAKAERLIFMNKNKEALIVLDSIIIEYPSHQIADDVFFAKAQINLSKGLYNEADSLLAFVVEHFPQGLLADEVLFLRAELQEKVFNEPQKALALYQQLLTNYPGSINTVMARNHFRRLRENIVN